MANRYWLRDMPAVSGYPEKVLKRMKPKEKKLQEKNPLFSAIVAPPFLCVKSFPP